MELHILNKIPEPCNENNQHEYTPIIPNNPIIIHKQWYTSLPEWIKKDLDLHFPIFELQQFDLPKPIEKNEMFWKFYYWYYELYDMYNYKECMKDTYFIKLTDSQREEMKEMCHIGVITNKKPKFERYDSINLLFDQMQKILDENKDTGLFVKTSFQSAKHEYKLFPAFTIMNIFENIIYSKEIYTSIDHTNHIILKPWNNDITKDTEFRVFVENKKVIAISQQAWGVSLSHEPYLNHSIEQLDDIIKDIPYNDAVLDINYTSNGVLTLIEINPGCRFHGAGSSLFTWQEIEDIKSQTCKKIPVKIYIN
ncbi:cell division cycle 123 protein [Klosneuvirus KNV1]|uniref:Cell division cycle 123 protein n=1 Tax=Klosneuvirus KNV1 TaxID=1977640 RepID=A0A1V0SK78_9VIRU|nr:cell division cycle 123 protein [Klosneuvirus KNV1]